MKKINKQEIGKILAQWQKDFTVFVPSRESGAAEMAVWDGKDTAFLDWYRNTIIPPKANFLQNMEKLFGWSKEGSAYKLETPPADTKKQIIFGIRPCGPGKGHSCREREALRRVAEAEVLEGFPLPG